VSVKEFDPVLVAWAAGLIEGEGCFLVRARRRSKFDGTTQVYGLVRVVMTDRDVLERLYDLFGGVTVREYRNTQGLGKKQLYRWQISKRADVLSVCDLLYPLMGERRRLQIDVLRSGLAQYVPVNSSERVRRTWISRDQRKPRREKISSPCGCGCERLTTAGRRFVAGHNSRIRPSRDNPMILCACGCGLKMQQRSHGYTRRFAVGHNRRGSNAA